MPVPQDFWPGSINSADLENRRQRTNNRARDSAHGNRPRPSVERKGIAVRNGLSASNSADLAQLSSRSLARRCTNRPPRGSDSTHRFSYRFGGNKSQSHPPHISFETDLESVQFHATFLDIDRSQRVERRCI